MVRDRLAELHDERRPAQQQQLQKQPYYSEQPLLREPLGDLRPDQPGSGPYNGTGSNNNTTSTGNNTARYSAGYRPYGDSRNDQYDTQGRGYSRSEAGSNRGGSQKLGDEARRPQQDEHDIPAPKPVVARKGGGDRLPRHQETQFSGLGMSDYGASLDNGAFDTSNTSAFLFKVSQLNADIDRLNGNVSDISRYHAYALEDGQQYTREREVKVLEEETTSMMNQVKKQIKAMGVENEKLFRNSPDVALRKNHQGQLRKKFLDVVQEYSRVEANYRAKIRQNMERQYRVVRPDASPEEISDFIERNDEGDLFAQALTNSQRFADASRTLDEVRSRHRDMMRLEKTIVELARMYEEVATLVQAQNETVVSIEKHVDETAVRVEQAVTQIDKAQGSARTARKRKWCLLLLCVVLLAIAVLAFYLTIGKDLFSNSKTA